MKHLAICLVLILAASGVIRAAEDIQFKLTPQSFEQLKKEKLPQETSDSLKKLENQLFSTKETFLKAVEELIGKEQTLRHQEILVKCAAQEPSLTKRSVKSVVKNIISLGKDIGSGIGDGITEGRKAATSPDGAQIVTDFDELQKVVKISVSGVKSGKAENETIAELGFKNLTATPIRISGLTEKNKLLLIDNEGFATALTDSSDNPYEITVPSSAGIRQTFTFSGNSKKMKYIRIFSKDIELKAGK